MNELSGPLKNTNGLSRTVDSFFSMHKTRNQPRPFSAKDSKNTTGSSDSVLTYYWCILFLLAAVVADPGNTLTLKND